MRRHVLLWTHLSDPQLYLGAKEQNRKFCRTYDQNNESERRNFTWWAVCQRERNFLSAVKFRFLGITHRPSLPAFLSPSSCRKKWVRHTLAALRLFLSHFILFSRETSAVRQTHTLCIYSERFRSDRKAPEGHNLSLHSAPRVMISCCTLPICAPMGVTRQTYRLDSLGRVGCQVVRIDIHTHICMYMYVYIHIYIQ